MPLQADPGVKKSYVSHPPGSTPESISACYHVGGRRVKRCHTNSWNHPVR